MLVCTYGSFKGNMIESNKFSQQIMMSIIYVMIIFPFCLFQTYCQHLSPI